MAAHPLPADLPAALRVDARAAISAWLAHERPIDPDAWSERAGFTDSAHFTIVDLVEQDGRWVATLGLDYQAVINLGCSRTWLALTIDPAQGVWSVAPRFAEDDEPEL